MLSDLRCVEMHKKNLKTRHHLFDFAIILSIIDIIRHRLILRYCLILLHYRLGDSMSVRLPTDVGYPAVAKESEWLPKLAPSLSLAILTVLGVGQPGEGYLYPWSIRGWQLGETAGHANIEDMSEFAVSLDIFNDCHNQAST